MKDIISRLNKAFESRIRLGIMSVLIVNDHIDFISLKEILETTDGNLASHLRALEKGGMLTVQKQFVGRKPKTTYRITTHGKKQFENHINALEELIKKQ